MQTGQWAGTAPQEGETDNGTTELQPHQRVRFFLFNGQTRQTHKEITHGNHDDSGPV